MIKCPCHNCPDRVLKCHADCERYKAYLEDRIKIKKDLKNAVEVAKNANRYSG